MADATGRMPVEMAPDAAELDRIGSNVENIFRASRGIVATLKDARVLGQTDGKFRVFSSLVDYRDFYHDCESWLEITDPAERRAFYTAARVPLEEMNVRNLVRHGGELIWAWGGRRRGLQVRCIGPSCPSLAGQKLRHSGSARSQRVLPPVAVRGAA